LKDKKKVCGFEATDSTDIRWSPCGQLVLTSTCAPRLRQANGHRVWHYTGSLLHEVLLPDNSGQELWEARWRASEAGPEFTVQYKAVPGIPRSQPQASKVAYRPPGARAKPGMAGIADKPMTTPLQADEPAENQKGKAGDGANMSKSAAKNKKRREAAKKKREEGTAGEDDSQQAATGSTPAQVDVADLPPAPTGPLTSDRDKRLKKLYDKLASIKELKQRQAEGKQLELNQLEKVKKEKEIADEIRQLQL